MTDPTGLWRAPEVVAWRRSPMHTLAHAEADGTPRLALDGDWRFELFGTPEDALAAAGRPLATAVAVPGCWTMQQFDDVHGVRDLPWYTNVRMPWPDPPPVPPAANPTGVYERDVDVPAGWDGSRVVLHVGAAESMLLLFVDGVAAGASKDSHLAAEFDLTGLLTPGGRHTLRLVVPKWSDATFIEDQDQWWHGGLTRPVFLYATPQVHLADVRVTAGLAPSALPARGADGTAPAAGSTAPVAGTLRVDVDVEAGDGAGGPQPVPAGWSVRARLDRVADRVAGVPVPEPVVPALTAPVPAGRMVDSGDRDELLSADARRAMDLVYLRAAGAPLSDQDRGVAELVQAVRRPLGRGRLRIEEQVGDVVPWSAEVPARYELVVTLHDPAGAAVETASYRIGFRTVEVVGRDLLVNGVRVYLRGMNRHDFDPLTGRVISAERVREDLLVLKRFGFNALRTSHYPNDPVVTELADELGLFVVDEADIECHAYAHHLAADPRYLSAFVDRVSRMVARDRNRPSVILWSLGNESGYGPNHDAAAGWVRSADPSRPLHYEGAIMFDWVGRTPATDVVCPMYPPIGSIVAHATSGAQQLPLVMCEYSHAMGNSNGTLAEYWQAIESTPGLQGGFIWEMWDHGILQPADGGPPTGVAAAAALADPARRPGVAPAGYRWAYGGDFGETPHDGTFINDGMVLPDRTPKPAMAEHRQLAAPVRLRPGGHRGEVVLHNAQHWRDLSWLAGEWLLTVAGGAGEPPAVRSLPAALPDLPAGASAAVEVPAELLAGLPDGLPDGDGPGGAETWLTLRVVTAGDEPWGPGGTPVCVGQLPLAAEGRDLAVRVSGPVAVPAPEPTNGATRPLAPVAEVPLDEDGVLVHPLLAAGPRLALWRAPTDNDRISGLAARWERLGLADLTREVVSVEGSAGAVRVTADVTTGAGVVVRHVQELTPVPGGLLVTETVDLPDELTDLPRVGTVFEVRPEVSPEAARIVWFGTGPGETYPDRCAAETGRFEVDLDDWFTPYTRPQESGGRHAVRWFALSGGSAGAPALEVHLDAPLQVSVTRYRAADLDAAGHHTELVPRPAAVVHLDVAHRGLGTASCGPDTLPQYLVGPGRHRWSYALLGR